MASNVPVPTFGPTGFTAPAESDVLAGVLADYQEAFGGNLNPALDTPQGQLATSLAAIIGWHNDLFRFYTNQVDPAFASGRMQDAIGRIYYLQRNPPEPTVVQAVCSGATNTVIPTGALAVAVDGNIYSSLQSGTIPAGGSVTIPFACVLTGPIVCGVGSLNRIYRSIPGWDSITNAVPGVIGQDVETRQDFEARRAASVALNALGTLPSIRAAVLNVPGVLDAYVTENSTAAAITPGGVTIPPHSLYVAAVGGTDAAVAQAIWSKKNPGCGYTGNTVVTVLDTSPGYVSPYPSYSVTFQRPTPLPVLFVVTLANSAAIPSDAVMQIRNALVAAFAGSDGAPRATIGSTIFASRFYADIATLGTWARIVSVLVGSSNTPSATVTGSITGTTLTTTAVASGALAAGQTIIGANVLPGTTILSGSGSTWVVSRSQTVASETLYGVVTTLNDLIARIDQVPTIDPNNISVVLV